MVMYYHIIESRTCHGLCAEHASLDVHQRHVQSATTKVNHHHISYVAVFIKAVSQRRRCWFIDYPPDVDTWQ